ncbi:MAG: ester cyclase [Woeseiaceae bacterium]
MAVVAACKGDADQDPAVEQNMAQIRAYVDAANGGEESYLDEYLAPGYVYHGPGGDLDRDGFKSFHHSVNAAFPGLTFKIEDLVAAGDKVVTRWTLHGVQKGPFQGIAPTGKAVTVTGIIITRFEDGKAVEEWEEANLLGMMQQLGALHPAVGEVQ